MTSPDASETWPPEPPIFGYVVANPFGLPKGSRIFSWEDQEWYEGDAFGPSGLPLDFIEWLIEERIIVKAAAAEGGGASHSA